MIPDEEWFQYFASYVMRGVCLSRYYLPGMTQRNWGGIVFISSESAAQIPPEMIQYGVTKTAQLALWRGLAETTAGTGVTLNAVPAGPTAAEGATEFVNRVAASVNHTPKEFEREFFRTMRPTSLLRRCARPEEWPRW